MQKIHELFQASLNKPQLPIIGLMILSLLALRFHLPALSVVIWLVALAYFYLYLRNDAKQLRVISDETVQTDAQLRLEVIEVQKLALVKLAGADDELKNQFAELMADAAMHLGHPYMGGRMVYGSGYVLKWNKEGLALVSQARTLVESYTQAQS